MPRIVETLFQSLRRFSRRGLVHRRQRRKMPYEAWCARYDALDATLLAELRALCAQIDERPKVELLLVNQLRSRVPEEWLAAVRAQIWEDWRLRVLLDAGMSDADAAWWKAQADADARIVCVRPAAPPQAHWPRLLAGSDAAFCLLLSGHDYLRPHTLLKLVEAAVARPDAVLVYGDEDRIDDAGRRHSPWFKADFDPESLLGHDAVGRPALFRIQALLECLGAAWPEPSALSHALALRITAGAAERVVHVPHLLCHTKNAPPLETEAAARAVQDSLDRRGIVARAVPRPDPQWPSVRVHFTLPEPRPWVTVIVPSRNNLEMLRRCVTSLLERTTYAHYDVLIVDNGSDEPACVRWLAQVTRDARVRVRRDERPFNFASLNNEAVREARGELVALLNDDVEVITPDWLEEMSSLAARPDVGAVGARLLYGDGSLQHGGVIVGLQGAAGHVLKRLAPAEAGPGGRARLLQSYLAVTAACLVVRRALYEQVGGMDAAAFAVAFNDVDFCLKLHAAGYRNLWTPHAELYHHESVSRRKEASTSRKQRLQAERASLRERWPHWIERDPHYNPNLTLLTDDFALADPPRVALTAGAAKRSS